MTDFAWAMSEEAIVIKTDAETAWIELEWNQACSTCRSRHLCFSGSEEKKNAIQVQNSIGAAAGDRVEIEFPAGWKISSAAWIFGIPVCFMLAGYFAGVRLFPQFSHDSAGLIGTGAALAVSLLIVRLFDRKGALARTKPVLIRIVNRFGREEK